MLSDLAKAKAFIDIPSSDTTQDQKIVGLVYAASAVVQRYCKQLFETQIVTEYPLLRGSGEALVLQQTPILCYRLVGTITSGQATITGLSSTSSLIVGMPALLVPQPTSQTVQPFPNGATIASVDSSSQVTMSDTATYSATSSAIIFGLSLWLDPNGLFGDGPGTDPAGPFGAVTQMLPGQDYALQRDQPDGTSKSGKVIRLSSVVGALGMGAAWSSYGSFWGGLAGRGTLTSTLPPLWGKWPPGSIKVVYAAGWGYGADPPSAASPNGGTMPETTTLPPDLTAATNAITAWMWRNADTGLLRVQSESFQGYNASIAQAVGALKTESDLGSTRQILSRFRKVAL